MNIALGGYKAHGASKNGNVGEEEGAPSARAEEAEESGSAESDKGAPRHDPCSEKTRDVAKAKPLEDKAAAQEVASELFQEKCRAVLEVGHALLALGYTKSSNHNAQEEQQEKQKKTPKQEEEQEEEEEEKEAERNRWSSDHADPPPPRGETRQRSQSGGDVPRKQAKSLQTPEDRPPAPPPKIDKEEPAKASPPPAAKSHGGEEKPQVSPPLPTPGGLATPRPGAGAGREGQVLIAALFDMISGGWLVGLSVSGGRGEWLGGGG